MPQPHRGDRAPVLSRPPRAVRDAVKAAADAHGVSVSDYVAIVLAKEVGMADLAPSLPGPSAQGSLPIEEEGTRHLQRSA